MNTTELWAIVNNAGIAHVTEMEWCSMENLQRLLDVNTVGPARVTKTFLPLLRRAQGRIVIVASTAGIKEDEIEWRKPNEILKLIKSLGRIVLPSMVPYSMSKFAAVALGEGLRREMKKWSVTVHTIEPSFYKFVKISV